MSTYSNFAKRYKELNDKVYSTWQEFQPLFDKETLERDLYLANGYAELVREHLLDTALEKVLKDTHYSKNVHWTNPAMFQHMYVYQDETLSETSTPFTKLDKWPPNAETIHSKLYKITYEDLYQKVVELDSSISKDQFYASINKVFQYGLYWDTASLTKSEEYLQKEAVHEAAQKERDTFAYTFVQEHYQDLCKCLVKIGVLSEELLQKFNKDMFKADDEGLVLETEAYRWIPWEVIDSVSELN